MNFLDPFIDHKSLTLDYTRGIDEEEFVLLRNKGFQVINICPWESRKSPKVLINVWGLCERGMKRERDEEREGERGMKRGGRKRK